MKNSIVFNIFAINLSFTIPRLVKQLYTLNESPRTMEYKLA